MIAPVITPTFQQHGYNMSIADGEWFSYRYHPNPKEWRTKIMIGRKGIERKLEIDGIYADMSHEDARFFRYKNQDWLSVTVAAFHAGQIPPCATIYGRIEMDGPVYRLKDVRQPKYGRNDFSALEKNWCFFQRANDLYFIYEGSPEQVVCQLLVETVGITYRTKSPTWEHGDIRGGTQPLPYKGKWLRFFHSLHKHTPDRRNWTYCVGSLVMSPEPPFQIEAISKWPVFSGDERYVPNWRYFKHSVAIPYGATAKDDGWLVGVGLNDSYCATLFVQEKDLNL